MLNILFMGTPDFAIPALEAIETGGHNIIGIVTQPDRPKGRGKKLTPPPVKEWAVSRQLNVYQPVKVRDAEFVDIITKMAPDLIVTAAFGQILPKEILDVPALGCINVHASLLPAYRGASPIQQAIIDGADITGITIMYMDIGMDTGDIILQRGIDIYPDENAEELHDKLAILGGQALGEALKLFQNGAPKGTPQNHGKATYCGKIDKSLGEINWNNDATSIKNLVRGLTPWPGVYTIIDGKRLKIWATQLYELPDIGEYIPGQVITADSKNGLIVACGYGTIRLIKIQGPGGRPMEDTAYLLGNQIPKGIIL